jgi:hypothetical protein
MGQVIFRLKKWRNLAHIYQLRKDEFGSTANSFTKCCKYTVWTVRKTHIDKGLGV